VDCEHPPLLKQYHLASVAAAASDGAKNPATSATGSESASISVGGTAAPPPRPGAARNRYSDVGAFTQCCGESDGHSSECNNVNAGLDGAGAGADGTSPDGRTAPEYNPRTNPLPPSWRAEHPIRPFSSTADIRNIPPPDPALRPFDEAAFDAEMQARLAAGYNSQHHGHHPKCLKPVRGKLACKDRFPRCLFTEVERDAVPPVVHGDRSACGGFDGIFFSACTAGAAVRDGGAAPAWRPMACPQRRCPTPATCAESGAVTAHKCQV
jgi:hypothetical protein